jgi:hypothetical protein
MYQWGRANTNADKKEKALGLQLGQLPQQTAKNGGGHNKDRQSMIANTDFNLIR